MLFVGAFQAAQAANPTAVLADTVIAKVDSVSAPTCLNGNDGAIFISVGGGTAPYSFQWSNGDTTEDLTGQPSGLYSVSIMDADSIPVVLQDILLPSPTNPVSATLVYEVLPGCLGQLGALGVAVSGNAPPFGLAWSNGATSDTIFNLPAGIYDLVVEDSNGCTASYSYTLELADPTASITADGDITCDRPIVRLDGSASILSSNSVFEWTASNGGSFASPTDTLVVFVGTDGTYSLTLTDTLNSCSSTVDIIVGIDTLVPLVDAGPDVSVTCTNAVLDLSGNVVVGPNHSFTAQWAAFNGGHIVSGGQTLTPEIDHAGTYVLTVEIVESGCTATDTVLVTGDFDPPALTVTGGILNCLLPSVQLSAQVDTANTVFSWAGPNGFSSNELEPIVTMVGDYVFTVTDTLTTCTSTATASVIPDNNTPMVLATGGTITCINTTVTLDFTTTSTDISVEWTGPNGFVSTAPNPVVTAAGDYLLTVTDTISGCFSTATATVAVDTLSPVADAGNGGQLTCVVTSLVLGGAATSLGIEFDYAWSTATGNIVSGGDTPTPTVDAPGTYTLLVTNTLNGCTDEDSALVTEDSTVPPVSVQGGNITCVMPTVTLGSSFNHNNTSFGWTGPNGFTSTESNPVVNLPGSYTLTVVDTLTGCVNTATAQVGLLTTPPSLQAFGGILGCNPPSITINAVTQNMGVTFAWVGPNGFTSTQQNPSVSAPGNYFVTATITQTGCTATAVAVVTINTTPPIAVASSGFMLGCNGTPVQLSGAGSSQGIGFTYLWTTLNGNIVSGANTLSPLVNAVGTYTIRVTNSMNGCTATASTTVTQIPPVNVSITAQHVPCFGLPGGAAITTVTGGTGNYTYVWSNGLTSPSAIGIYAGSYSVTVNGGGGCTATATTTITQPASALSITATATNQTMPGVNNGTATVIASGGTPSYFYNWSNGASTPSIFGLAPGAYGVTVTDFNGCSAIATVNVNSASCNLAATMATTNVACFGTATGSATVTVTNAMPPVQYNWSTGSMTTVPTLSGLAAGNYSVTVTDNSACSLVQSFQITQPASALAVTELAHTNVPCPSSNTGSITAGASGGTQPYSYAWSNGGNSATISNLGVGTYMLTVTDSKGCKATLTSTIIGTDNQPPVLVLKNLTVALNANGQASVTAVQFNNGSTDNCGIASWSASPLNFNCNQLGTQTVTVTVTDVNGLQSTGTAQVTVQDLIAPSLACPANIVVTGCNPTVNFSLPTVTDNCSVNMSLLTQTAGLPSGSNFPVGTTLQSFKYTDASGNMGTCNFQVTVSSALTYSAVTTNATCAGACDGAVNLTVSGGVQPVTISWSNGGDGTGLCAGSYTATIVDASGCSQVAEFTIDQPAPLVLTFSTTSPGCPNDLTGSIQAVATGGTGSYDFAWSNGNTNQNLSGLGAGAYTLVVTDDNGCSRSETVNLVANDNEAPTLVLQNINLTLGANGSVALNPAMFDAGTTDNCGIATWSVSPTTLSCANIGLYTVSLTVTDVNGNTSNGTATVTVTDNIVPVMTCPFNVVVGFCVPVVTFSLPIVDDNCPINPAMLLQTNGLPSGSNFPVGTTTQSFNYTDPSGNTAFCSFNVTVNPAANLSLAVADITCYGVCNGIANIAISGGIAPFSVEWNDGQTGTTATNLCEGTHQATVTDANGCPQTVSFTLTAPAALQLSVDNVTNDVNGTGMGAVQITVSGGTMPYNYAWTLNGQSFSSNQDLSNLTAGDYEVVVMDANGCIIASDIITVQNLTGVGEASWSNGAILQPNPAAGHTVLVFQQHLSAPLEVLIFDINGKLVQRRSFDGQAARYDLDITALSAGVYSVQLHSAGGMAVRRLVVGR